MLFGSDMAKCAESQKKMQSLVQSLHVQERAEWAMDHLLKKSSPRFFRSLSPEEIVADTYFDDEKSS